MGYKNLGKITPTNVVSSNRITTVSGGKVIKARDGKMSTGLAFLVGELEKLNEKINEPLSTVTWARDIPVKVGGGWVEKISAMGVDYGIQGGGMEDTIISGGANQIPVIQYDMNKGLFNTHIFSAVMRINWIDMQKSQITNRSLEQMATNGIRQAYDKHQDTNVYLGFPTHDCYGLFNRPEVTVQEISTGATSKKKKWKEKTPDEILLDINTAILAGWENSGWDISAIPNHILVPYEQLNYLATTRIGELAEKTILSFLLENNVAKVNDVDLEIAAVMYAKGAGTGNSDRMVCYVNDDKFIAVEELVPLKRAITQTNPQYVSLDSVYVANLSEVEVLYDQPITYWDGI